MQIFLLEDLSIFGSRSVNLESTGAYLMRIVALQRKVRKENLNVSPRLRLAIAGQIGEGLQRSRGCCFTPSGTLRCLLLIKTPRSEQ